MKTTIGRTFMDHWVMQAGADYVREAILAEAKDPDDPYVRSLLDRVEQLRPFVKVKVEAAKS